MLALFDAFGFPDCAAELALLYHHHLPNDLGQEFILNALTPQQMGALSYKEYMAIFEHMINHKQVYPFGRIQFKDR